MNAERGRREAARTETAWDAYAEATLGFRNHWYPAFFGHELAEADVSDKTGSPVAHVLTRVILGERLLFRRIDGRVHCVRDQCLHKGVPFSKRPECYSKGSLTCWYHGFTYDLRSGDLTGIITDPTSPLIGKARLTAYPVEEARGMVFVFVGDGAPPPLAHDLQPGFLYPELAIHPRGYTAIVNANWRLGAENGFDPAHTYMHRNAALVRGYRVPTVLGDADLGSGHGLEVEDGDGPKGVRLTRGAGRPIWRAEVVPGVEIAASYLPDEPGVLEGMIPEVTIWMPCGLKVDPFPTPTTVHFEWYVPVSERSHRYFITWGRRLGGDGDAARKGFLDEMDHVWRDKVPSGFTNEDVFAREAMDEFYSQQDGWHRERLFGPDVVTTAWRRLCARSNRGVQRLPGGAESPTAPETGRA